MNTQPTKETLLLEALREAVALQPAQALFLSGGIDSAFLAAIDPKTPAITVGLEGASDLQYAGEVAKVLKLDWYPIKVATDQALEALHDLVLLTKTFDIGLLNDIPLFFAMRHAKEKAWLNARTGDAADTLFCGYSYLQKDGFDIQFYLQSLLPHFTVQSGVLGRLMGMDIYHPYLYHKVVDIAKSMTLHDNVQDLPLATSGDFFTTDVATTMKGLYRWGKVSLRNAAKGLLPEDILWRVKTDLMFGSGMHKLEKALSLGISEYDLQLLEAQHKHFWNLAHVRLFLWYQKAGLTPQSPIHDEYQCQWCGAGNVRGRGHCNTCGAYPAQTEPTDFLVGKNF